MSDCDLRKPRVQCGIATASQDRTVSMLTASASATRLPRDDPDFPSPPLPPHRCRCRCPNPCLHDTTCRSIFFDWDVDVSPCGCAAARSMNCCVSRGCVGWSPLDGGHRTIGFGPPISAFRRAARTRSQRLISGWRCAAWRSIAINGAAKRSFRSRPRRCSRTINRG